MPQLQKEPDTAPKPKESRLKKVSVRGGRRGGRASPIYKPVEPFSEEFTPNPSTSHNAVQPDNLSESESTSQIKRGRGGHRGAEDRGTLAPSSESEDRKPIRGRIGRTVIVNEISLSSDSELGLDHSSDLDMPSSYSLSDDSDLDSDEDYLDQVNLCLAAVDVSLVLRNVITDTKKTHLTQEVVSALELLNTIPGIDKEDIKKRSQKLT